MTHRILPALLLSAVVTACVGTGPGGMEPFVAGRAMGVIPQIEAGTGSFDYSLIYTLSADGQSITTRFRGASSSSGVALMMDVRREREWRRLTARVAGSDVEFLLAEWRLDDDGQLVDASVRRDPFIEWMGVEGHEGEPVEVRWRPIVDGIGSGAWRD